MKISFHFFILLFISITQVSLAQDGKVRDKLENLLDRGKEITSNLDSISQELIGIGKNELEEYKKRREKELKDLELERKKAESFGAGRALRENIEPEVVSNSLEVSEIENNGVPDLKNPKLDALREEEQRKRTEIVAINQALELQVKELEVKGMQQRNFLFYSILGSGFLMLVSVLLFRSTRIKNKANKLLASQKAITEQERDKSDKLLLNILPPPVAEELKAKGKAEVRHYDLASVLFTDFKGFTSIAEKMTPKALVEELDICFAKFDEIITKHNLEKIKTIGDAYMCAGGLPSQNQTNPIEIVLAGLEIQRFMDAKRKEKLAQGTGYWQCRLGINSGDLIAGVIGRKKFAYDVWGDTVNTASRMESSGEVGKVNISGNTYDLVQEFFDCEYRGKINAKNKGEIDMYFVKGIKAKFSNYGEGLEPNNLLKEKIRNLS